MGDKSDMTRDEFIEKLKKISNQNETYTLLPLPMIGKKGNIKTNMRDGKLIVALTYTLIIKKELDI